MSSVNSDFNYYCGSRKIRVVTLLAKKTQFLNYFNPKTPHQHLYNTIKSFHQLQIPEN
jgi:hypothetical protein